MSILSYSSNNPKTLLKKCKLVDSVKSKFARKSYQKNYKKIVNDAKGITESVINQIDTYKDKREQTGIRQNYHMFTEGKYKGYTAYFYLDHYQDKAVKLKDETGFIEMTIHYHPQQNDKSKYSKNLEISSIYVDGLNIKLDKEGKITEIYSYDNKKRSTQTILDQIRKLKDNTMKYISKTKRKYF